MRPAFIGLGEGIGNVVMGIPLIREMRRLGYDPDIGLACTPPEIAPEIAMVLQDAYPETTIYARAVPDETYDLAVLSHWYLEAGGKIPKAEDLRAADAIRYDFPEILQNLEPLEELVEGGLPEDWGRAGLRPNRPRVISSGHQLLVGLHPGCKPAWREAKWYPRWHEVVHRLQDFGARVTIFGGDADADIYCGRPDSDQRGELSLLSTCRAMRGCDVILSGDSGPHHLAVAMGLPTVALFGDVSIVKAHHPSPPGAKPVIIGPIDRPLERVNPYTVATACLRAVGREPQEDAVPVAR